MKGKTDLLFYKTMYADVLSNIGFLHKIQGRIEKALNYYFQALAIDRELNYKKGIAIRLNNIGSIYDDQGKIEKALNYYHQALLIDEELNYKEGIAIDLNNIGLLYKYQGRLEEALNYYQQALLIDEELNYKEGIATVLNNIGSIYDDQGKIEEALNYYQQALTINQELNFEEGIAIDLINIGSIYSNQGKIKEALNYYQQALKIDRGLNYKKGIATDLNNIGSLLLTSENSNEAKDYLLEGHSLALELGSPKLISSSSKELSLLFKKEGNYELAFDMYALHIKMRDSINNLETQKKAIQQQAKYEYKTQKAIDDAESEKLIAIEKEETEKQKIIAVATICGIIILSVFLLFVYYRLRLAKKQQKIIAAQKREVEIINQKTEKQKIIIEETYKEITDSINYAKRLQSAILPSFSDINHHIKNNFVLFQPKDVVSGDFYWFENKNDLSLIASADCTGHGVPGALVSVVCSNALHRTVNEFGILEPSKILNKTRDLVIETFAKSGENVKDGMDIALCAFSENKVVFSGANNPLWIVRNLEELKTEQLEKRSTCIIKNKALIEFKADRQPVGLYEGMKPFTQTEIDLIKGDTIYFFTDGFADQFGGEKGKKFMFKPFKKLLIEVSTKAMKDQKEIIQSTFNSWKGDFEQVDDVCIIGVRIT